MAQTEQILNNSPERLMGESYEDYCERRSKMNKAAKKLKQGQEFWDASYAGTYRNDAKRNLQEERKARRNNKRAI